jgi:hypothetical protein
MPNANICLAEIDSLLLAAGSWTATQRVPPGLQVAEGQLAVHSFCHALTLRAMHEKMVPMLVAFLRDRRWPVSEELESLNTFFRVAEQLLYKSVGPLLETLMQQSVPFLMIKGADLASRAYPSQAYMPRMMRDIDILVLPADLDRARLVMEAHGFRQGHANGATMTVSPFSTAEYVAFEQLDHYELPPFYRYLEILEEIPGLERTTKYRNPYYYFTSSVAGRLFLRIKCDLHFNLSRGIHLSDLWDHTDQITLQGTGQKVSAQSISDLIWVLGSRFYHEVFHSGARIRQFIDLLGLVASHSEVIDWERVLQIAEKYELRPSLYYVFFHLNEFLEKRIPGQVLDACYPARTDVRRDHDWGDFMPRLLRTVVAAPLIGAGRRAESC